MTTPNSPTQTLPPTVSGRPALEHFADAPRRNSSSLTRSPAHHQNISATEKTISQVGGAALMLAGLTRGRWSGSLLSLVGGSLLYRGFTGHCYAYETLGIDTACHPASTVIPAQTGTKVEQSITINRPAMELYSFWREVENLPRIMRHLKSVEAIDSKRSRWLAEGPMGTTAQWEAEIFNEEEAELIAWRSLPESQVATTGSIRFKELKNGRGTAVTVSLKYNPPGGKVASAIAWLLGSDAEQEIEEDLRRFKSQMETGEVPTIKGQPSGRSN